MREAKEETDAPRILCAGEPSQHPYSVLVQKSIETYLLRNKAEGANRALTETNPAQ